jgi:hypothetical protein
VAEDTPSFRTATNFWRAVITDDITTTAGFLTDTNDNKPIVKRLKDLNLDTEQLTEIIAAGPTYVMQTYSSSN